jgi:putative addiction module antidote
MRDHDKEVAMSSLKIRKIGNSLGVVLPQDILARHQLGVGDVLHVENTRDGIALSKIEPDFDEKLKIARHVMKKRFAALRELAK